ncbi:MAG: CoA-binding protein [Spirochaetes bacterium]|nr:MAG: CoA-binding protein [Spirochaetota bacterium]
MLKFTRGFFDKEILFVGFTEKYRYFCTQVYNTLTKKGFQVYALTGEPKDKFSVPVYATIDALPVMPRSAYLITDKDETARQVDILHGRGVKKILFNSKNVADQAILNRCRDLGIETAVACPLMLYGGGLHRLHGFFAGVK